MIEVDTIIFATGFDGVTGSLAQIEICGTDNRTIAEHWKDGVKTAWGIAMNKFPNMFFLYGPQAPTAFSNGPSCVQMQADWLFRLFYIIIEEKIVYWEAKGSEQEKWAGRVKEEWEKTLFPLASSWYQGANVPSKKVEPLNWPGGMVEYRRSLDSAISPHKWFIEWSVGNGGL